MIGFTPSKGVIAVTPRRVAMALVQELNPFAVPQSRLYLEAGSCHRVCSQRYVALSTETSLRFGASTGRHAARCGRDPLSSRRLDVEKLWRDFFSDPSEWWDNRGEKVNPRFPDFKHRKTQQGLWLDSNLAPSWVEAELASLAPGSLQSDIFSWNIRLQSYVKAGKYKKAMETFQRLQQEGISPDKFTFIPILNACARSGELEEGRHIHQQIIQNGHESDIYVTSCLVDMYTKCRSIKDAWRVFSKMPSRNVVSWNAMILGYAKGGEAQKALELFGQMHQEGVEPSQVTFVGVLNACASVADLEEGRLVHEEISRRGYESNIFVGNSLIDMYVKCGSTEDAEIVFNRMPSRTVVSWTAMILGYVRCGEGQKALELSRQMYREGLEPSPVTFVGVLTACASVAALEEGKLIHQQICRRGYESNVFVSNSLVDMYAKCGSIEDAQRVFRRMASRDVVSWTTMILGYLKCGEGQKALELSREMFAEGIEPNPVTFVGVLNACASVAALEEGRLVHEQTSRKGYESDVFVASSLVAMYAKCGSIEDAQRVFDKMPLHDLVSWNTMILGYVKCGEGQKALDLGQQMDAEGVEPDATTYVGLLNACSTIAALGEGRLVHEQISRRGYESDVFVASSLVDMYAKCGSIEDAQKVFNMMPSRTVVSWNAMIEGYVKSGQAHKALELSQRMDQEGMEPSPVTFVGLLNACASVAALEEGRLVHEQISQRGYESEIFVASSLVHMYAKCGSIEDAQKVFNKMPTRDVVSWNAMLAGYAMHGWAKEALEHFERMCQEYADVDGVTFGCLLLACSHGGLMDEGLYYFESMTKVHNVPATMEHYACVVDILGRSGNLHKAEDLIRSMPCEPEASLWTSLLGACRVYGNVEMGECVAKRLQELEPENASSYVLLSNIYSAAARRESVVKHLETKVMNEV